MEGGLASVVAGCTGGKEGFRTRWKIYGGPVDKLCFISRDVIFIKAAGRCLLPPYTPVVRSYRAVYMLYVVVRYTMLVSMQLFTDIQMRVYRINDMLMDLSSELKFDLCRKNVYRARYIFYTYTLPNWGEYLFRNMLRERISLPIYFWREIRTSLVNALR